VGFFVASLLRMTEWGVPPRCHEDGVGKSLHARYGEAPLPRHSERSEESQRTMSGANTEHMKKDRKMKLGKLNHILARIKKFLSYREAGWFLRERRDCLKCLPTLRVWARNSLSDIFSHSLLNFALIRWSSCINFGSLLFMSNLFWGRYFNHRISLLSVNSHNFQFRFHFNHMFEVPTNQDGNVVDRCYGYVESVREIFFRYNLSINIVLGKLSCFFGNWKKFYLIFFDNTFKKRLFGFLRCLFNFIYGYVGAVKGVVKQIDIFKELCCDDFYFRILSVQPVYDRSINVYSHVGDYIISRGARQGWVGMGGVVATCKVKMGGVLRRFAPQDDGVGGGSNVQGGKEWGPSSLRSSG